MNENGREVIYVPIHPIGVHLGVNWAGQYKRIQRDLILTEVMSGVVVTPTPLDNKHATPQEMLCLLLDYLNGFLFGINISPQNTEKIPFIHCSHPEVLRSYLIRY